MRSLVPAHVSLLALGLLLALAGTPRAAHAQPASSPHDPLMGILRRMDRYLEQHEVDGVTMDWRYSVIPSEEIRQTVVCQVLGESEIYRVHPTRKRQAQIARHLDYLVAHLNDIKSGSPFDGMLGLALLVGWDITGDPQHRKAAMAMVDELEAIPTYECILNGGLMVAMAMAAEHRLTGDAVAGQKATEILNSLARYQNADGSFPHWCYGSEDIHYTGWMSLELVQIERWSQDLSMEPTLARMGAFLESRGYPTDTTHYQEPCGPGCIRYYYSRASGCSIDYDTRGWTVEPAYDAVVFDHLGSPAYSWAIQYLDSLETGGTLPDLWGYWPPPDDPEYPWTIADTSVVNMSIIYWALGTILSGRRDNRALAAEAWGAEEARPIPAAPVTVLPTELRLSSVRTGAGVELRLDLPQSAEVALTLYDPGGRKVRELFRGPMDAGSRTFAWDGRDANGVTCASGVYWAQLRTADAHRTVAISLLR